MSRTAIEHRVGFPLGRALFAAAAVLAGTSCTSVTTLGGLMVVMNTDGSLDPDALEIEVTSPDGTKTYREATYQIPKEAVFPTSVAVASNGDPTASVAITVSVWADGAPLDVRQDLVLQIPTDRVAELDIYFSARCTPLAGLANGVAVSKCASGLTCDPGTGACVSGQVSSSTLPTFSASDAAAAGAPSPDVASPDVASPDVASPDGATDVSLSCLPGGAGLSDCGKDEDSCCTSLAVEGGTFDRTYTNDGTGATEENDPAVVSSFRLDKYPVTVGRFRRFVNVFYPPDGGAGFVPPAGSGKHTHVNGGKGLVNSDNSSEYETGWLASDNANIAPTAANLACDPGPYATWTPTAGPNEHLPINCVNWWEAYAFCIWDGGFLPSEAEYEYAAAGGNEQREYPWGAVPLDTSNQYAIYGCLYPNESGGCNDVSNIAPVGTASRGAGRWGQLDLAGNVWQWNIDWYAAYADPCADCAYLTLGSQRASRGGDFGSDGRKLVPQYRSNETAEPRTKVVGFRCARAPSP